MSDEIDNSNYGQQVRIQHSDGFRTVYAHLSKNLVEVGQAVNAGELIGLSGDTGNSFGAHLHLTLKHEDAYENGEMYQGYPYNIIDPTPYLDRLL